MLNEVTPYNRNGAMEYSYVRANGTTGGNLFPWARTASNTRVGSSNIWYKSQIARGRQAGTSFIGSRTEYIVRPYYYSQFATLKPGIPYKPNMPEVQIQSGTWCPYPPASPDSLLETEANNIALQQLVTKIRSKQTSFQGAVFAGELGQTIRLLRNPAMSLRRGLASYIAALKKMRPGLRGLTRKKALEHIADTWLEYQLGWAPLISETDNAIKALAESGVLEDPKWVPVRAFGKVESSTLLSPNVVLGTSWPRVRCDLYEHSEVFVRYISCVDVGTYSVWSAQRVGFAPSNWVPTLWELVPYSFVVDYFTNIGNIVSAASLAKSSVRWTLKTTRRSIKHSYRNWRAELQPTHPWYSYSLGQASRGAAVQKRTSVGRAPYYGSLVPSLEFSIPNTATKWLNIAALIAARRNLKSYFS